MVVLRAKILFFRVIERQAYVLIFVLSLLRGLPAYPRFFCGAVFSLYLIDKVNLIIMSKTLKRSSNSMIAGVCAGVANYFDIDPTVVRILWVIFTLCGGAGILLYIIMLVLMPK